MFRKDKKRDLQNTIDDLLVFMEHADPESNEYSCMADQLLKLYEAKDKEASASSRVTNTAIVAATNLMGIIVIANYERVGVWTTRAFSHILKNPK